MAAEFEIAFPLTLDIDDSFTITFLAENGASPGFSKGMYYLFGDNGSGKSTFLNLLALTAGRIGSKETKGKGGIRFNGTDYRGRTFSHIEAADLREKYFCIFPQKVFFLPVSSRDNYLILNGSDEKKALSFSSREYPDMISGGQQQKILMDIVLDEKKPVWFLDEPLTNLDAERRRYFWRTLYKAFDRNVSTIFYIDHTIGKEIREDNGFRGYHTLRVVTENRRAGEPSQIESRQIEIYTNNSPKAFFLNQVKKIETEKARKKQVDSMA